MMTMINAKKVQRDVLDAHRPEYGCSVDSERPLICFRCDRSRGSD